MFKDGKLLMVQETSDGKWAPSGGWADVNDVPSEAVTREIWEESGYETRATTMIAVCDRTLHEHQSFLPFHVYKLSIQYGLIGGEAKASIATQDIGFFGEDELTELSPSRVTQSQTLRLFEHGRKPNLPIYFDWLKLASAELDPSHLELKIRFQSVSLLFIDFINFLASFLQKQILKMAT